MLDIGEIKDTILETFNEKDIKSCYEKFAKNYRVIGCLDYGFWDCILPFDELEVLDEEYSTPVKGIDLDFTNNEIEKMYKSVIKSIKKINKIQCIEKIEFNPYNEEMENYKYGVKIRFYDEYIACNIRYPKQLVTPINVLSFSDFTAPYWYKYNTISLLYNVSQNNVYASMSSKKKMSPLTLKTLSFIIDKIPTEIVLYILDIIKPIFENCKSKLFFKDIKDELLKGECYVPVKLEYLFNQEIKSKKMLFDTYYKLPFEIPKSVNKRRLTDTYIKTNLLNKIKENERQKIWCWEIKPTVLKEMALKNTRKERCLSLYCEYLKDVNKISIKGLQLNPYYFIDSIGCNRILYDMATMAYKTDRYFNLGIKSMKSILKRHNDLIPQYTALTAMGKLKFPKDDKFKELRLPDNYELIKSAKRLKEEGVMQNNCVYSYLEDINLGRCVIYSTVYQGKRYTIEITAKKKGKKYQYYLAQIQGYGNVTPVPEELIVEIDKLLG